MSEFTDSQLITADRTGVIYGDVVTFSQAAVGQFTGRFTGACTQLSNWTARATATSGTCTGTFTQANSNYENTHSSCKYFNSQATIDSYWLIDSK